MKEIEKGIETLHTLEKQSDELMEEGPRPAGDPIAVVNKVTPGSPASFAVRMHHCIVNTVNTIF